MKPKLRIITSSLAPYRIKLFENLKQKYELEIILDGTIIDIHPWDDFGETNLKVKHFHSWWKYSLKDCEILLVTNWTDPRIAILTVIRRIVKLPTVLFYESTPSSSRYISGFIFLLKKFIFRCFTSIITVGVSSSESISKLGISSSRVFEGFNAVDNEFYSFWINKYRQRLGKYKDLSHHVIFVGRLVKIKNVASALTAWSYVKSATDNFYVAGSGPEEENLMNLARDLGIEKSVVFLGYVKGKELCKWYAEANTLILPSIKEVWGLVANEALAGGLHLVISNRCGASKSVEKMEGVYVCDPSVDSIGESLSLSKSEWSGPVANPVILQYGPEQLAKTFSSAIDYALKVR